VPPTGKKVNFEFVTVARWIDGLLVEEYIWADAVRQARQLGFLPSPVPAEATVGLELGHLLPLTTRPGTHLVAGNKARLKESDDALNAGKLDAGSLHLADDVTVYGIDDQPVGLDAYLDALRRARTAVPDLHLNTDPYVQTIGSGDWTGTIARLTGTHTGPLQLPGYLAPAPVPATCKTFDVLHTIARWQDDKITHLRVMPETFGILTRLGLT
jgi:predicted ester cyclase